MGWLDSVKSTKIINPWLKSTVKAEPTSVYSPYIPQAKEEVDKERKKTGVLQWLFDRLSTGQYVVANLVDEIITSAEDGDPAAKDFIDVLKAMGEGVTGQRRGDWAEILKRRLPEGEFTQKPIFGENREGKFLGKTTGADVVGFLANIFLDPTTYLSFGATKGATAVGKSVADDIAKLVAKAVGASDDIARAAVKGLKNIGDDVLEGAIKGYSHSTLKKLLEKSPDKARQYLSKFVTDTAQVQNRIYKETFRTAKSMSSDELRKMMLGRLGIDDALSAADLQKAVAELPEGLRDIGLKALGGYGKEAGMSKLGSFFGKEFGVKQRKPWQETTSAIANFAVNPIAGMGPMVNRLKSVFHPVEGASKLSDAWFSVINRGPIRWFRDVGGDLGQKIGIRNPYQKYLRQIELQGKRDAEYLYNALAKKYVQGKTQDPQLELAAQWLIENEETYEKTAKEFAKRNENVLPQIITQPVSAYTKKSPEELIALVTGSAYLPATVKPPKAIADIILKNPEGVANAAENIDNILYELRYIENQWARLGYSEVGEIQNYIPKAFRSSSAGGPLKKAAYEQTRSFTRRESEEMITKRVMKYFNLPENQAKEIVDAGITDYATNLDELMLSRLMAHSKMESRVNMLEKFKELGVPRANVGEDIIASGGGKVSELGLKTIEHPALKEFLYDKDVAQIIDRALAATGKEMGAIQRIFTNYTKWWKGLVTMTTGFHLRNFQSNNFTGFMKHGYKWFQVNKYAAPAMAGVIYATNRNNPANWAKLSGMSDDMFKKMLNRTFGEGKNAKTLRELVDDALRRGVISESQQGFDPLSMSQKLAQGDAGIGNVLALGGRFSGTTVNPLPTGIFSKTDMPADFIGFRASRSVGNVVENTPRFQSFLIDFDDLAKKDAGRIETLIKDGLIQDDPETIAKLNNYISDYASLEAKKWFIDYEDLTDFEKNVLKNIIPFYSWLRRNIANQLSGIALYPGMYALVPKAEEFLKYSDPNYDESLVPDYMRQLGYFPIGKLDKKIFTLLNPNLPFQDLARIPISFDEEEPFIPQLSWKEMKDDIVGAAHPVIKSIVEMIPEKGYDTWRKKDLEGRAVAPVTLRMFTQTPRILQTLDGFLRFAGFDEGLSPRINEEGKLELNAKILKVIENNLPIVRTLDQMVQTIATVQAYAGNDKMLQQIYEEMSQEKTPLDATKRMFNVASYWLGVKRAALDLGKEEDRYYRDIYNKAGQLRGDELLGAAEMKKRLQRQKKDTERIRKIGQSAR